MYFLVGPHSLWFSTMDIEHKLFQDENIVQYDQVHYRPSTKIIPRWKYNVAGPNSLWSFIYQQNLFKVAANSSLHIFLDSLLRKRHCKKVDKTYYPRTFLYNGHLYLLYF